MQCCRGSVSGASRHGRGPSWAKLLDRSVRVYKERSTSLSEVQPGMSAERLCVTRLSMPNDSRSLKVNKSFHEGNRV